MRTTNRVVEGNANEKDADKETSKKGTERMVRVSAKRNNGGGVVARMEVDRQNEKRQPGRVAVPCGTRHSNGVEIVMVGSVRWTVKVSGANEKCERGRVVIGGCSGNNNQNDNGFGRVETRGLYAARGRSPVKVLLTLFTICPTGATMSMCGTSK